MKNLSKKNIIALSIGNALEWYDFFVYSFVSVYFAKIFFPSINPVNTILASTATFGVALLIRPLGGVILGYYADKFGRIKTLNLIIWIMSLSIILILITPSYQQLGIYSPLLILLARLLQGFSTGAEFGVSASILNELSPTNKRGFYSSLQTFSQMIAVIMSSLIGIMLSLYLNEEQIQNGGWRIPFLIGLFIIPIGIYIRRQMNDEPHSIVKTSKNTLIRLIKENIKQILIVTGLVSGGTVSMYVILSYMPIYATRYLHLKAFDVYLSILIGVSLMTTLIPFFGWLSDYIGKKKLLLFSMMLYIIELYPCFAWLNASPSLSKLIIIQSLFCFSLAIYYGAITAAMTSLFSANVRSICLSIGFNLGVMIFGAFAQFIVTLLIELVHSPLAITIYPLAGVIICLIAIGYYQEDVAPTEQTLLTNPDYLLQSEVWPRS